MTKVGKDWELLVVGDGVWGRGRTEKEAREKAGKPKDYILYLVPPGTVVTPMGDLQWQSDDETGRLSQVVMLKQVRGKKEMPPPEWK